MTVKQVFASISREVQSQYERTVSILHNKGKGDAREAAFKTVFEKYLPERYKIGHGEVIDARGRRSREQDIVIFDSQKSPRLSVSDEHDLFPVETVYGSLQIKSSLTADELSDAYKNIASLKRLRKAGNFTLRPTPAMSIGLARPLPYGAVIAYSATRSLKAIAEQASRLDTELGAELHLAPELIVVLGEGLVGTDKGFRQEFNEFTVPADSGLRKVRSNKHHSLLRFFMQAQRELDSIILEPLDLTDYLEPVDVVDGHIVRYYRRFMVGRKGEPAAPRKLSRAALGPIISFLETAQASTYGEALAMQFGDLNVDNMPPETLSRRVFVYNPHNNPPISQDQLAARLKGEVNQSPSFSPMEIEIDGKWCLVDLWSLGEDAFEDDPDADWDDFHP